MVKKLVELMYQRIYYFVILIINRGSLSDSQKATKSFAGLTPVSYVLPISMFEKQEALVAIELHRYSDTEQFNVIGLYTVDLNGDGI